MKYAILVLLLLMFGCIQSEEGKVTEISMPDNSQDGGAQASDSPAMEVQNASGEPDSQAAATGDGEESAEGGGTQQVTAPTITNPNWGNECEDAYDCEPYDSRTVCVMGKCEKADCIFRADCKEKDHCFNGKCYLESELYGEFPECGVNVGCNITCAGCESGKRRCLVTGWGSGNESKDYYICVDCNRDYDCAEGYKCVQNYCVKGPN